MSPKSQKHKRRAFTLVELLVVIGIIALLISILLPALSKARKSANTVKCLAQQKQLMSAFILYSSQWKGAIPWTNWDAANPAKQPYPGWLYDCKNLVSAGKFDPKDLQLGVFWDTLGTIKAYRCPDDPGPWPVADIQNLTTYIMNGSLNGFTDWTPTLTPRNIYRITDFKGDTAVLWEIGSAPSMPSGAKNDGANRPYEAVTVRHAKGTTISFMDGHAEIYSLDRYMTEVNKTGGRDGSVLWRSPRSNDGGHTQGNPTYTPFPAGPTPPANSVVYSE
jgi:prepilin-type N-terminal cleavage/methylation domain-containing protein/prepilin-type processing-associated H-X9-DG protein